MQYDAFISYSTAADERLAPRLQLGLEKLAKPWSKRRALRVFRDESGLGVTPDLWDSIVQALDTTRYFILLASPGAARSEWVNLEIEHWLSSAPDAHERILPVLTSGSWEWDGATRGFTAESTAVPEALRTAFVSEPRYLDLTWARHDEHLDLRRAEFRAAVADLAAPIHGIPKDELESDDIRAHRRTVRLRRAAVGALAVFAVAIAALAVAALVQASIARDNERLARANEAKATQQAERADRNAETATKNAKTADARRIAAQAELIAEEETDLAALLAKESLDLESTSEGQSALANVMTIPVRASTLSPAQVSEIEGVWANPSSAEHPDGDLVAYLEEPTGGRVRLYHAGTGEEVELGSPIVDQEPLRALAFSADGTTLFTGGYRGALTAWDSSTGQRRSEWQVPCATDSCGANQWITDIEVSTDGRLAVGTFSGIWVFDGQGTPDSATALSGPKGVAQVQFEESGSLLAGYRDGSVRRYEFVAPPPASSDHAATAFAVDSSSDGNVVASADVKGGVRVIDRRTGRREYAFRHDDTRERLLLAVAVDPAGRFVASAAFDSPSVSVWDLDSGTQTEIPLGNVFDLAFAPDGSLALAVADGGLGGLIEAAGNTLGTGRVVWWDAASNEVAPLAELGSQVLSVDVSPNGAEVVAGTTGGEVSLIDRKSGSTTSLPWCGPSESCPFGGELLDWIFRLRFSDDGERIAASGNGGEIALWNLEDDRGPLFLLGHEGFVHGLAFTDDDSVLVSVGMGDGAVRHWSTESGIPLGVEQPTGASLGDAATGPDGTIIVATGNGSLAIVGLQPRIDLGTEGGRMVWPGPDTWDANVCEVAGRNLTEDEWSTYLGDSPRRATCPEYPLP